MSLPSLTRLRYFVAVAETLNFRKASETLHVAQPAVSRSVQMLEKELGFKLLTRTTRRVRLTEAGSMLAEDARRAMRILELSVHNSRQIASGQAGEVLLAYSAQAAHGLMADLVVQFQQSHSSAAVGIYQMASDEQQQAIENGQIDVGFMLLAACSDSLSQIFVRRERFVLLVSRHHHFATRESIALKELTESPFVMGSQKRWGSFLSLVETACRVAGFSPTVVEEAGDVPVLLQLVAQQRGVTLYGSAVTLILPPDVVAVPISDTHAAFDIGLAWDATRMSPLVKEFVSFVESVA